MRKSGFGELIGTAREAARADNLERALELIAGSVIDIGARDSARARVFSSAELDAFTLELGRGHALVNPTGGSGVVIMATALLNVGGHTRVIQDLIAAEPASEVTVVVSNLHHDLDVGGLAKLLPAGVDVRLAPKGGMALTMRWLQRQLVELGPARTYLFNHPYDAPIVAACQPELTGDLYFYHHNDHSLTLGAHVPHAVHIDFNAKGYFNCHDRERVTGNILWPLSSAQAQPVWKAASGLLEHGLTTACLGTINKFEPFHVLEPLPYAIGYDEVVATVLTATGGRHLHVGQLSGEMLNRIEEQLSRAGFATDRFIYRPFAPSLAGVMEIYGVDLYLGSFPRGGGRATVEAMAAGLPLLLHSNYRSIFFCDVHEAYLEVRSWRTLGELARELQATTPELLASESARGRDFFNAWHAPDVFAAAVAETLAGARPAPSSNPRHAVDDLQVYLDERAAHESVRASAGPVPSVRDTLEQLWSAHRAADAPQPLTSLVSNLEVRPGFEVVHCVDRVLHGSDYIDVWGWVFGEPEVTSIVVLHDDQPATVTRPNIERPDVLQAFPNRAKLGSGFFATWRWIGQRPPPHRVSLHFYAGPYLAAIATLVLQSSVPELLP